ncbi:fibronectin type III domain-containing protein [Polaribacter septentrionalilitoris]|uniref:fibronectin type III domain-containing protein n=1 Tax=Polaribacter septentrionalilitoris TaxID=2494657 RepID=UPI001357CCBB|nr:fibronectin type III domain-containing protein [Polaribacter septentrionalilitoris]
MKKTYLYFMLTLLLTTISCGSDSGNDIPEPEPEVENTAPTTPSLVYPLNNTVCIDNNIIFKWNASTDAEGNAITYMLEVSENSAFSPLLEAQNSFSESKLISLDKGKAYYWRIKAVDNKSAESEYSEVSQFLTEGNGTTNHIPFAPSLVAPALNSEIDGTNTTLSWSASDVDGDALTFDVYLDTNSEPNTLVSENQSETTFNATNLSASSTYYFKIVVKDGNGATSIGQVWSFTTK